ncbi:MAG TPA: cation transporter [Chitinophagaceae bacterium]|nr:cation transporter [Chitinophagaceae bacterium]
MKALRIFPVAALLMITANLAVAQTKKETFKVSGNCGMCKSKIEKAAKEAGAKEASWDADSKQLTVSYKSSSTNTAKIQQKIADVGYDNIGFKATAEAYNKLHGCCKYDREGATAKESCCSDGAKCTHNSEETHMAKMDCCKDGKCSKEGHDGKNCCSETKMDCCKDGKCTKEGHDGKDCCKKS